MKFNWGTGIFLFYTVFATALFYQVYCSTKYDHSLVTENYYEKDIAYQSHYDRVANSMALENGLGIRYLENDDKLSLQFPAASRTLSGTVRLYRASDQSMDRELKVDVNRDFHMNIPVHQLLPGRWKIEVEWDMDGKGYYDAKEFDKE